MSESVKFGDKVRVGPGMLVESLQSRQGEVLTVTRLSSGNAFWADDADGETYALYTSEVELVTDAQTIEVGDTVKATHTDGTTVQGVVRYADDDNVDITLPGTSGVAYLYENEGWTFEVVSKAVTPPNVGEPWREGLPLGTVMKTDEEGASILLTEEGWIDQYNYTIADPNSLRDRTTIAYLPESAND